jgi:hypothetical protein
MRVSEIIELVQRRNRWALPLPVPKMEVEVEEGENLKPSDCVRSMEYIIEVEEQCLDLFQIPGYEDNEVALSSEIR